MSNTTQSSTSPGGIDVSSAFPGLDTTRRDSLRMGILNVNIVFMALITLTVSLRTYSRVRVLRHWGWDDVAIVAATVLALGLSCLVIVSTSYGLGTHIWTFDLSKVIDSMVRLIKVLFAAQILYATAVALTKISIIITYLRIFPYQGFHKIMYATLFVVVGIWIASVLVTVFQCTPVHAAWDFIEAAQHHWKCIKFTHFAYAAAGVNVLTDFMLSTVPIPLFWKLKLSSRERAIICLLFGCGLFATIASVMRLTKLHLLDTSDIPYNSVSSLNWSIAEVGTGIFCASVPSIKPLIMKIWPGRFFNMTMTSRKGTRAGRSQYGNVGGTGLSRITKYSHIDDENSLESSPLSMLSSDKEKYTVQAYATNDGRSLNGQKVKSAVPMIGKLQRQRSQNWLQQPHLSQQNQYAGQTQLAKHQPIQVNVERNFKIEREDSSKWSG